MGEQRPHRTGQRLSWTPLRLGLLLVLCLFLTILVRRSNSPDLHNSPQNLDYLVEIEQGISDDSNLSEQEDFDRFNALNEIHFQSQNLQHTWGRFTLWGAFDDFLRHSFPQLFQQRFGRGLICAVLGLFLVLWVIPYNVWMGNRQRLEGGGSWRRLFWVAAVIGFLQTLPLQIGLQLLAFAPATWDCERSLFLSPILFCITLWGGTLYLLPPIRWNGTRDMMPQNTDPEFHQRLTAMSEKLGIRTPVARILLSSGGEMSLLGFAGGLPQPSLAVSDGILYRLNEQETDAIVAHELGHIANGSLWWFPVTFCIAWSSAVVVALWLGVWTSLLFGFALQSGLSRIISRFFEYDSDRRAASVVGFATTVTALNKIHLTSVVSNKGWISWLAYSMATHPSQEERLQALVDLAPVDDLPTVTWSTTLARRRKLGARIACALWASGLIVSLNFPPEEGWNLLRIGMYLSIIMAPPLVLQRAIRKEIQAELKRRQTKAVLDVKWFLIAIVGFSMVLFCTISGQSDVYNSPETFGDVIGAIFFVPIAVAFLLFLWAYWKNAKSPQGKIRLAIHRRQWQEAIELGKVHQEIIDKDPLLRHDLNLALWMTGEQDAAISGMQQLRQDAPDFKHPWLIEALMHHERNDSQRALNLIDDVRADLPEDVSVHGIAARCYRTLGNLDQMERETNAIEILIPDAAAVSAFRCAMSLDKGDLKSARNYWEEADGLAPGDAYITLLKSELEALAGSQAEAEQALTRAHRLMNATPFAFMGAEYQRAKHAVQGT